MKSTSTVAYLKNLDGIRFFCFLLVFLFHSFYTSNPEVIKNGTYNLIKSELVKNGNLGVNAFFTLSGFLITYLILKEQIHTGRLHLWSFYIRRILRIWPLYITCLLFGFILFPLIKGQSIMNGIDASSFPYYLSFTSNFDVLYNGLPDASVLGVLWSVAIEEQFYLFWPILFILFPKNKSIYPIIAVFIMSAVYRFTTDTYNEMEYHTLSSIGDMAVGGFAAYLIIFSTIFQEFFKNASKWIIISVYVLTIGFILWKDELCATSMFFFHVQRLIFASFIAFIILEQSFSLKSVFKLSRLKWISKLGKYTYGMYCFQFVGILIALRITQFAGFSDNLLKVLIIDTILALVITIFMSWLSYEYYEKRFLKLKTRFSKIDIKQNIVNEDPLQGN